MRTSAKWELYEPFPESTNPDNIIKIVKEDQYACFSGQKLKVIMG